MNTELPHFSARSDKDATARDAARYRWLRFHTSAGQSMPGSRVEFRLPAIPKIAGVNVMKGSVAQHLDAAIDAAMAEVGRESAEGK